MTPLGIAGEDQEMTRVESLGDVVANPLTGPDSVIYIYIYIYNINTLNSI